MKTYMSLGEALADMTNQEAAQSVAIVEETGNAKPMVDVEATEVFDSIKEGAGEVVTVVSDSQEEVKTLAQKFKSMTPVGKAIAVTGAYFAATQLKNMVSLPMVLGGAALYIFTQKKK